MGERLTSVQRCRVSSTLFWVLWTQGVLAISCTEAFGELHNSAKCRDIHTADFNMNKEMHSEGRKPRGVVSYMGCVTLVAVIATTCMIIAPRIWSFLKEWHHEIHSAVIAEKRDIQPKNDNVIEKFFSADLGISNPAPHTPLAAPPAAPPAVPPAAPSAVTRATVNIVGPTAIAFNDKEVKDNTVPRAFTDGKSMLGVRGAYSNADENTERLEERASRDKKVSIDQEKKPSTTPQPETKPNNEVELTDNDSEFQSGDCIPGARIGPARRYHMQQSLSAGAYGEVWSAVNTATGSTVAIKLIARQALALSRTSEYVQREILNHRTLCHPHVIAFREVFLTDQNLCIVMEFAPGGDMFTYICQQRCLSENFSRWFFQQLCLAIDYCHRRGVVNRDIKLENLLLDKEKKLLKVCDFGFSKQPKYTIPRTLVGTPCYFAPEVLKAKLGAAPYDGYKVDVWTCGVCLFVMLYGYYPFDDPTDHSNERTKKMLTRIINGDLVIPQYQYRTASSGRIVAVPVSDECRGLLKRILEPDSSKRISMGGIMQNSWFQSELPEGTLTFNRGAEDIKEDVIEKRKKLQTVDKIRGIIAAARELVPVGKSLSV